MIASETFGTCGKLSAEPLRKSEHFVSEVVSERKFGRFARDRPRRVVGDTHRPRRTRS